MRSFFLTVSGGLAIGMIESVAQRWAKSGGFSIANYRSGLAFVMVTLALLWTQRRETWAEDR
jgi:branched-chain amino acid transport system permease protein